MNAIKSLLALSVLLMSFSSSAEDELTSPGYISDDLFIYMVSGPSRNYRVVGTVTAGTEIQLTNNSSNDYTEIIDPSGKKAWVESQFVSTNPSLRNVIAQLNGKLALFTETQLNSEQALTEANDKNEQLITENSSLNSQIANLNNELTEVKAQLKDQDQEILKQWFFTGAIVLGVGLLLGILLPKLIGRKRKNSSWS